MILKGLLRDRRGNIALITGMLALPLVGMIGLAIDFGTVTAVKGQLGLAADAAALVGTTNASNAYIAKAADPLGQAQAAARQRFEGQANSNLSFSLASTNVTVTRTGTTISADVTYTAKVPATIGQVFGVSSYDVSGRASASISSNPYVDIQVLMDVSSSMLIAATEGDIARMKDLTAARGQRCELACHWDNSGDDFYDYAHKNNVTLRIDVLRSAVANLISTITALKSSASFRLGLYTFGREFAQIYPLNSNISAASAVVPKIAPGINGCLNDLSCADTFFSQAIASVDSFTQPSGTGISQSQSQKFLFLVTDGVVDQVINGNSREMTPLGKYDCDRLKAKGVTIMTLYTPYLPIEAGNWSWDNIVSKFHAEVAPKVRECASSPTLSFVASHSSEIDAKLQEMLTFAVRTSGNLTR